MVEDRQRRRYLGLLAAGAGTALAGCSSITLPGTNDQRKIDDWQYEPGETGDGGGGGLFGGVQMQSAGAQSAATADASVGLAAGGANDINTFRRNIEEGYLPQPESLSYEGLFYNYYFETGGEGGCSDLFCPSYSPAVTADPLSGETERYLTVGLNSGLDASSFERPPLNLVVVLDVSGSMSSSFSQYYYDRFGNRQTPEGDTSTPKIQVAREALVALTEQLRPEDRLGVVLYSSESAVAKPLRPVEETDMDAIRGHIREDIQAGGGTNLDAGLSDATELLSAYRDAPASRENRAIVLTDAMPNLGTTDDQGLRDRLAENAVDGLHTTFVGVGVDFNAELVDELTSIRGANYYSVHSTDEFRERMDDGFQYMVSPLVFDLSLELDAEGYEIRQVYGSSAAEESTGEILRVNTLFASPTEDGRTRGGVVLAQVERQSTDASMELRATWENRAGTEQETTTTITFPAESPEYFANTGVRKAVLLSRYADLLKNWMIQERDETLAPTADGIAVPPEERLGEWEQQSQELSVGAETAERIETFRAHFLAETEAIGDDSLGRELDELDRILAAAPEESEPEPEPETETVIGNPPAQ
jgi:Ca-activated chloride channel family protein